MNEGKRFKFSFSKLGYSGPLVFSSRKIQNISQIKRDGIRVISLKQCEFFFLSEVLAVVADIHHSSCYFKLPMSNWSVAQYDTVQIINLIRAGH